MGVFFCVSSDKNTVPAQVFEEQRDTKRNSQRVFLIGKTLLHEYVRKIIAVMLKNEYDRCVRWSYCTDGCIGTLEYALCVNSLLMRRKTLKRPANSEYAQQQKCFVHIIQKQKRKQEKVDKFFWGGYSVLCKGVCKKGIGKKRQLFCF